MNDATFAQILRILRDAADDVANALEDSATPTTVSPLKKNEVKLVLLLRQLPADTPISKAEYSKCGTMAGMNNVGRITSSGYVKVTGPGGKQRQITKKGMDWLAEHDALVD